MPGLPRSSAQILAKQCQDAAHDGALRSSASSSRRYTSSSDGFLRHHRLDLRAQLDEASHDSRRVAVIDCHSAAALRRADRQTSTRRPHVGSPAARSDVDVAAGVRAADARRVGRRRAQRSALVVSTRDRAACAGPPRDRRRARLRRDCASREHGPAVRRAAARSGRGRRARSRDPAPRSVRRAARSAGSCSRARASATRCRSPFESCAAGSSARSADVERSSAAATARVGLGRPCSRA